MPVRNPFDGNEQNNKDRIRKIDEIYQNLNQNMNPDLPSFNLTKNNYLFANFW